MESSISNKAALSLKDTTHESPINNQQWVYLTGWRLTIIIACLYFGTFLAAIDTSMITVSVPAITTDLHALGSVAWISSAYTLAMTAFQPTFGSCYKYFKIEAVYMSCIIIFEVGSIICSFAHTGIQFIIGRAISGLGAAGISQGALCIISHVVELEKRPLYTGIVTSVFGLAICFGPIMGGALTTDATWRWCYWLNLPVGAVTFTALSIFLRVQNQDPSTHALPTRQKLLKMDLLGALTFIAAICCLLLGIQYGGQIYPWKSARVIGPILAGGSLLIIFVLIQWKRGDDAVLPLRILSQRSIWAGFCSLALLGSANVVMPYMLAGELVMIAGSIALIHLEVDTSTMKWATFLVITGIGMGMAQQVPYTAVQVVLDQKDVSTGNAVILFSWLIGGAIAVAIGQNICLTTIRNELPKLTAEVTPNDVIAAGVFDIASLNLSTSALQAVREAWNMAVTNAFIISIVCASMAVPFTVCMEWKNSKREAERRKNIEASEDGNGNLSQKENEKVVAELLE